MSRTVRISAPSRLHFGLLRFGKDVGPSFGGLGMMVDQPRVTLEITPSDRWHAEGPKSERALEIAQCVSHTINPASPTPLDIRVCEIPPAHSGLGTGTQLAFAIVHGIHQLHNLPTPNADQLAQLADRGKRSAVGSHGYLHGGLIWELGQQQPGQLGTLAQHITVPPDWRILLIRLPQQAGLHGHQEVAAFKNLPSIPPEVTGQLIHLAESKILPAAKTADLDTFGQALYQYGHLSGSCFSTVQGGPFASPEVENLVTHLRNQGIQGVGQSSWGPTVFAFSENEDVARILADHLKNHPEFAPAKITLTPAATNGYIAQPSGLDD